MLRTLSTHSNSNLVDFSSNDYLSFSQSNILKQNLLNDLEQLSFGSKQDCDESPFGPPSSRLLDGNSKHHLNLEQQLTQFFRSESGLLFNSGFDANVGVWSCLPSKQDWIVFDSLIHASVHDGMRASRVPKHQRISFQHNNVQDLERKLCEIKQADQQVRQGKSAVWIGIETLYSMDGDLAPVKEMLQVVERSLPLGNGHMIVDEAHSTGLYGPQGRGVVCALGLANRITVRVHTFGKAMACSGGVVLASPTLRSYLINYARPLIYSTAMPRMNVLAIKQSFLMLERGQGDEAACHVHRLSTNLLNQLSTFLSSTSTPVALPDHVTNEQTLSSGVPANITKIQSNEPTSVATTLQPMVTTSPIIPLLTTKPHALSNYLIQQGFLIRPIAYPTVPKGQERIRICLHANNTFEQIEQLSECLKTWCLDQRNQTIDNVVSKL
ncbi:hypothetical protein OIO90_005540 [Microbotryomycetes sp. JL221]|nr:hypothetical protein OIO90_005540 [Microbotryomycetes sp. JL221]